MRWFRDRRAGVQESLRVAHRVESIDSEGMARSSCRLLFNRGHVEEIMDHVTPQDAEEAALCRVCVAVRGRRGRFVERERSGADTR